MAFVVLEMTPPLGFDKPRGVRVDECDGITPMRARSDINKLIDLPAAGVEPATFRSGGERSNPLSYAGLNKMACFKETNQECPPFLTPFCIHRQ